MGEPAFDAKADLIYTSLNGNANFPPPWPAPVPPLGDILTAKTDYHTKFEAAQSGDTGKIALRGGAVGVDKIAQEARSVSGTRCGWQRVQIAIHRLRPAP